MTPQVFISSTYIDNEERRKTVEAAVTKWKMLAWGMERFTASASPTVDECLRHVRESELFVLIVAHRYGWIPPGADRSITELEYDEARRHGKPCFVFLIEESVAIDMNKDYDPLPERWDKLKKLQAFKDKLRIDQMPGPFTDVSIGMQVMQALKEHTERAAQAALDSAKKQKGALAPGAHQPAKSPAAKPPTAARLQAEIDRYLERLAAQHESIALAGFETKVRVPVRLDDLYVPLRAVVDARSSGAALFADAEDAHGRMHGETDFPLAEAFGKADKLGRRRGLVILGDPGSGKTTQLKRMALSVARQGADSIGVPAGCVPVFVPLRNLKDAGGDVRALVRAQIDAPELGSDTGLSKRLLARDNLLVLLDGLDEVSDAKERAQVSHEIQGLLTLLPRSRIVVTCRYAGYTEKARLEADFLELHLRPFTREQSEDFIHRWFEIVETSLATDVIQARSKARAQESELVTRLREPEFRAARVLELTRNPLLLTAICLVHRDRGRLPERRGKLYHECVRILLELWRDAKKLKGTIDADRALRVLQPLALHLHQKMLTRASADELEPVLAPALAAIRWEGGTAREFLATIRDESGLLTGWSNDTFGFMHLGFQEYVVALEIRARALDAPELLDDLANQFGESWWQEVTLLVAALEQPSVSNKLFTCVFEFDGFTKASGFLDLCLSEALELPVQPMLDVLAKPFGKKSLLWDRQLAITQAMPRHKLEIPAEIRERLTKHPDERIADLFRRPRLVLGELEVAELGAESVRTRATSQRGGIELVRIPAGQFVMGSSAEEILRLRQEFKNESAEVFDREGPAHEVRIPEFYLAPTPVTNEQYGRFLRENPGIREPEQWSYRQFNQPNQPVVGVSWEEAVAFCTWAGLRLPSESEWEYACRAGTATRYWKGNTEEDLAAVGWYFANSGGMLHPVGEKPANPLGLYDMHGNVLEWCQDSLHDSYGGAPIHGSAWEDEAAGVRALRGGSFRLDAQFARSADRGWFPRSSRWNGTGFRPAKSS